MTGNDTTTMVAAGMRTYEGGCHCGAVRYRAKIDLSKGATKCNCSICTRTGTLNTVVKPEDFELVAGENILSDYQFNTKSGHHVFCKHCGVRSFASGDVPELGGLFYSVNVLCLDDVHLSNIPTMYWDGKHDNWMAGPSPEPVHGGAR
jgi:hypothetical protein